MAGGSRAESRASPDGPSRPRGEPRTRLPSRCTSKLESMILPLFYQATGGDGGSDAIAIAMNGSFFNTQRMLEQYVSKPNDPEKKGELFGASAGAVFRAVGKSNREGTASTWSMERA